ncbi:MAG TPA: hypothetical protein VG963_23735, partial [Polyangiaceae bacterium]|nr:hypothetical protein [Polyangiaceae bacterium]
MKSFWCLGLLSPLVVGQPVSVTIESHWAGLAFENKTLRFTCSPSIENSRSEKCRHLAAVIRAAKDAPHDPPKNWL